MVLGDGVGEGGRYGSVGDSGAIEAMMDGGGDGRSSSSSSSVIIEDGDDGSLVPHDVYQRQPLIPNHDTYNNASNSYKEYKENGNSFFNGSLGNNLVRINIPSPHRDEPRFPKEKMKTLFAFIFVFLNWVFTVVSLALTHERVPDISPLPDIVLDNVTYQRWGLKASEIIIIVSVYICTLVVLFHKHRYILFRRIFIILGLLYFYRSITMYVTVLPKADPTYPCSPKVNVTSTALVARRAIQLLSGFGLSMNGQHTFCGDYIYSGHTVCLVMSYLIVKEYTPRRWWLLHWFFCLLALSGVVLVLIAKGHYTVDCLIAYYITTRIFYIYHTLANNQSLQTSSPTNYFERLWWFKLFQYFEGNVQGTVPRHYEWPLPWPRRWSSINRQRTS